MRIDHLDVLRWAHGGEGVGVPSEGPLAGAVVFVPGAVPGDVVDVEVVERRRRFARGRVVRLVAPSPERRDPPCPVQTACGGCPWMTGSAAAQRASRLAILEGEVRKRLGPARAGAEVSLDEDPRADPAALGYRARVRLAFEVLPGGGVVLGYRAKRSHHLVDVAACAVAAPPLNAFLPELRAALSGLGPSRGEARLVAGVEGVAAEVRIPGRPPIRLGPEEVNVQFGDLPLAATPDAFLQANPAVAARIMGRVEEIARTIPPGHAVELFAGLGTLTIPLLRAGHRVTAYESSPASARLFERNTAPYGRAILHTADLSGGLPSPAPEPPDLLLLDPPREGALALVPWLRAAPARLLVYVSCDVATALRDLAVLLEEPSWRLESVTGFDLFPHTGHQEVLAVARRR